MQATYDFSLNYELAAAYKQAIGNAKVRGCSYNPKIRERAIC